MTTRSGAGEPTGLLSPTVNSISSLGAHAIAAQLTSSSGSEAENAIALWMLVGFPVPPQAVENPALTVASAVSDWFGAGTPGVAWAAWIVESPKTRVASGLGVVLMHWSAKVLRVPSRLPIPTRSAHEVRERTLRSVVKVPG